jgi:23S rRNA pseudouridine2605 synthase
MTARGAGGAGRGKPARRAGEPSRGRPGTSGRPASRRPAPKRAPEPAQPVDVHDPDGVRLQKVLAEAGVGSRRACEVLISTGRVQVDGHVVRELGVRIDPSRHTVHVDGMRLQLDSSRVYLAFNKPAGVVSTMKDESGRPSLADYVGDRKERLFHVGRLDSDTEGLILLTNDGELAHRLQHPSYGVLKTYLAEIDGPVARDAGRRLREGIELDDGPVRVDSFKVVDSQPGKALVEVVLHEGRKHIVRRALDAVGHPVHRLVRVQMGPVRLGDLRQGRWRVLTATETGQLFEAAGL